MSHVTLVRRSLAEFIGTALLLVAVVGSGIAAESLSPGDAGLQLLENALATGAALAAIILAVGRVSGAHLNPVITLADRAFGGVGNGEAGAYVAAQLAGGVVGTVVANLMFSLPVVELSTKTRSSGGLWLGETVATLGLTLVVFGVVRSGRRTAAPFAVGAYISGAVLFTSSTSFANPAVTAARTLSDSFTGIEPASVTPFVLAQLLGGVLAVAAIRALYPAMDQAADGVLMPRVEDGEDVADVRDSLERWQGARITAYLPLFVERFSRERLRALAKAEGSIVSEVPEVLFVCVHNAGRSQMAAALLDHHAQGRVKVRSAGSAPADEVNPAVAAVMADWGIDVSQEFPKPLTDEVVRAADVVITMGCGDACPIYPGKRYLDWELDDPAGKSAEDVAPVRDEIDRRVRQLLAELVPAGS